MIDRIEALRRLVQAQQLRWQRWNVLEAVGWTLSAVCGYFLAAVSIDSLVHLPMAGRFVTAAGLVAVLIWFGRWLTLRWRMRHAGEDEIALAMERRVNGTIENRLINALQIGRGSGTERFAEALVRENCRHLSSVALPGAMSVQPAAVWLLMALLLTGIVLAGWMWQPRRFNSSAARILLPFATIEPVYRTRLEVEPGNLEGSGDIEIRVRILGERPTEIAVLVDEQDRRSTHTVPVHGDVVVYTLPNVQRSLSYSVRGGDFTSPFYRIEVLTPARVARLAAIYRAPDYTRLPKRSVDTSGDLEGLAGSRVRLRWEFDRPVEHATMTFRSTSAATRTIGSPPTSRWDLQKISPTEFATELALVEAGEYVVETVQAHRAPHRGPWHQVRVIADEPPKPTLSGLPTGGDLPMDESATLQIEVSDDLGVTRCGLFFCRLTGSRGNDDDGGWVALQEWPVDRLTQFSQRTEISAANLGVSEGERVELAARASDAHPDRADRWITGAKHVLLVAGDGAQLQMLYEQILKSEAELAGVIGAEEKLHEELDQLLRKLDNDPTADDNLPGRVKALAMQAVEYSRTQAELRETSGRIAREMVTFAGSLRLSVGMLADSEMIRGIRILDSVASRDDAAGRRASFADARATARRTLQSLNEIHNQYIRFRKEWELAHMTPFLRMLADRQAALRDRSQRWNDAGKTVTEAQQMTGVRRQAKLAELCRLASAAFAGLAERAAEAESPLSEAFAETAESLESLDLREPQSQAQQAIAAANWAMGARHQQVAATILDETYQTLRDAQTEAARQLLAGLEDRKESDLAAQAELEKLKAGYNEDLFAEPEGLSLENIIHQQELEQAKQNKGDGDDSEIKPNDYLFPDSAVAGLQRNDTGVRQKFENLSLATSPGKTPSFPSQSDRAHNKVKPHIQEKFDDLVGELLEEEDEMKANYETYNLNAAFNINEKGDVGKQGGDMNSTAASAATGNQKPPTTNVGGISRVGRQGARAHGMAVGGESINRRGRDKVQEGQFRSPDQNETVKETKSDDPQTDTSAGIGGRKVESDDAKFATGDAGEWSDDMLDRLDKPQEKNSIVERQGAKLDANVAEMMRDMHGKQEQTIERLKTIRKDLKNLYLPTEHLDQSIDQLQANLHSLNERPSTEIYRLQQQTLERVRGVLQVFHQAHSGFQASLPREQQVRGRVVDDPSRSVPPGYEDAVKTYYQRLAAPERMR